MCMMYIKKHTHTHNSFGMRIILLTRAGIYARFESMHVHFRLNRFASTELIQRISGMGLSFANKN